VGAGHRVCRTDRVRLATLDNSPAAVQNETVVFRLFKRGRWFAGNRVKRIYSQWDSGSGVLGQPN
jgi:hypothetical protein